MCVRSRAADSQSKGWASKSERRWAFRGKERERVSGRRERPQKERQKREIADDCNNIPHEHSVSLSLSLAVSLFRSNLSLISDALPDGKKGRGRAMHTDKRPNADEASTSGHKHMKHTRSHHVSLDQSDCQFLSSFCIMKQRAHTHTDRNQP